MGLRALASAAVVVMTFGSAVVLVPSPVLADITCYDFVGPDEPQTVYDALPGDPYGLDTGWPPPIVSGNGDQEAGNGVPCDAEVDLPELDSPGDEDYEIGNDPADNGLDELPDGELEEATIREAQYTQAIQTEEKPDLTYRIIGVATPEFETYADYEDREVPGQCGADAATARLQELLAPGTTVWMEIDEAGFAGFKAPARHIWIELGGRYRLVAEVLVSEGHAVVATERPGTGRADARENPPPGTRYRDALRDAQERAIEERVGLWEQCAG